MFTSVITQLFTPPFTPHFNLDRRCRDDIGIAGHHRAGKNAGFMTQRARWLGGWGVRDLDAPISKGGCRNLVEA